MGNQKRATKLALGMACAAGMVAGAVLSVPTGAAAADGQALVLGRTNEATSWTVIHNPTDMRSLTEAPYDWSERDFEGKLPGFQVEGGALLDYTFGYTASINDVSSLRTRSDQADFGAANLGKLHLNPSTVSGHPKTGQRGDLFVDKDGKLWFCKGGTSWKQIA